MYLCQAKLISQQNFFTQKIRLDIHHFQHYIITSTDILSICRCPVADTTATVEFYSGRHVDETPRSILIGERRLAVSRVIREYKLGCNLPEGGYHRIFIVEAEDGTLWQIREAPQLKSGWELRQF
jgi:hypothetical protein